MVSSLQLISKQGVAEVAAAVFQHFLWFPLKAAHYA